MSSHIFKSRSANEITFSFNYFENLKDKLS